MSGKNWRFLLALIVALAFFSAVLVRSDVTSLSTDKAEYYRGELVTIRGTASPGEWVAIQVKDPNGVTVWIDQVQASSTGSFSSSFQLAGDAAYGTYTVYATPPSPPRTTTFKVVAPPPPPPPPARKSSSITISIDRTTIALGESVTVKGVLTPGLNVTVTLSVTSPNGSVTYITVPASLGVFTYVFKPDSPGTWSFKASWAGNSEYEGCESSAVTLAVQVKVSLQVVVAPSVAGVGGTVVIYVNSTPPLKNRPVVISYSTNKTAAWKVIGVFETSSSGVVVCVFTPSETGEYRFKAEWSGDSAYLPASAVSSKVVVMAKPLTAEDVLNMTGLLKNLQVELGKREEELKSYRENVTRLQEDVKSLQVKLSSAQTDLSALKAQVSSLEAQLSESRSRLAEAEARAQLVGVAGTVVGLVVGFAIGYFVSRKRLGKPEASPE